MLYKFEAGCVQLSALFRKSTDSIFLAFSKNLYGIISLKSTILHCLPFSKNETQDFEQSFCIFYSQLLNSNSIPAAICVNGMETGSQLILNSFSLINKHPFQINKYNLLGLNVKNFSKLKSYPFQNGEQLIRCKSDIPQNYQMELQALQEKYEKEEVLPEGCQFDPDNCRLRLKQAQRTQYILALDHGNCHLVAKAASNAIGERCVQIGGVFTDKQFRGNHYGFNTVLALCVKILKSKKVPVLFVKQSNTAANSLYKSLKFNKLTNYTIAYF